MRAWLPRWYWGHTNPALRGETHELVYYGFAWGLLTIGRWRLRRVRNLE